MILIKSKLGLFEMWRILMKDWVHTSRSDAFHKNQFISEIINKSIKDLTLC